MGDRRQPCWECSKAVTNGCSWADRCVPVKGWVATPKIVRYKSHTEAHDFKEYTTYDIKYCPEFDPDSFDGGLRRKPHNEMELATIEDKLTPEKVQEYKEYLEYRRKKGRDKNNGKLQETVDGVR